MIEIVLKLRKLKNKFQYISNVFSTSLIIGLIMFTFILSLGNFLILNEFSESSLFLGTIMLKVIGVIFYIIMIFLSAYVYAWLFEEFLKYKIRRKARLDYEREKFMKEIVKKVKNGKRRTSKKSR